MTAKKKPETFREKLEERLLDSRGYWETMDELIRGARCGACRRREDGEDD